MRMPILSLMHFQSQIMSNQVNKIGILQAQASTGKKLQQSSEDPLLSEKIKSVESYIEQLEGFDKNLILAENRLSQKASIAAESIELMGSVKELLLKAQNGTLNDSNRQSIALELNGILNRELSLANSKDVDGSYMFSGYNIKTQPFIQSQGKYIYQGSDSVMQISIGLNTVIDYTDPGNQVFSSLSSGDNVFDVLSAMVSLLQTPVVTPEDQANLTAKLNTASVQLDQLTQNFINYQTDVGTQGKMVHNQKMLSENLILDQKIMKKSLEDADMPKVLSELTQQMTMLEITNDTYAKMHQMLQSIMMNR